MTTVGAFGQHGHSGWWAAMQHHIQQFVVHCMFWQLPALKFSAILCCSSFSVQLYQMAYHSLHMHVSAPCTTVTGSFLGPLFVSTEHHTRTTHKTGPSQSDSLATSSSGFNPYAWLFFLLPAHELQDLTMQLLPNISQCVWSTSGNYNDLVSVLLPQSFMLLSIYYVMPACTIGLYIKEV